MNETENRRKIIRILVAKIRREDPDRMVLDDDTYRMLCSIPYLQLIRPLVIIDRKNSLSWKQISIKYNISPMQARYITGYGKKLA